MIKHSLLWSTISKVAELNGLALVGQGGVHNESTEELKQPHWMTFTETQA